jgi:hypothetical protein
MTVTVQTPSIEDAPGLWLSIKLAADKLTVSERTVSRWITRGKLRRRYREDGHVEVWVPLTSTANDDDNGQDVGPDIDGHERSLQLLERVDAVLTRQQLPLIERIDDLTQRVEAIARENGQLTERNAVLARELDIVGTLAARAVSPWRIAAVVLAVLAIGATVLAAIGWLRPS